MRHTLLSVFSRFSPLLMPRMKLHCMFDIRFCDCDALFILTGVCVRVWTSLSYMSVLDFTSPDPSLALVPPSLLSELGMLEGDQALFTVCRLPVAKCVQLEPLSEHWSDIPSMLSLCLAGVCSRFAGLMIIYSRGNE